jgi:hypothetical protein
MIIDWSKAPEGTEAAHAGCSQLYMAWYRRGTSGTVEQICPGAGVHSWQDMGGRLDFPFGHVPRPAAKTVDQREQTRQEIIDLIGREYGAQGDMIHHLATTLVNNGYRKFEIVEEDV